MDRSIDRSITTAFLSVQNDVLVQHVDVFGQNNFLVDHNDVLIGENVILVDSVPSSLCVWAPSEAWDDLDNASMTCGDDLHDGPPNLGRAQVGRKQANDPRTTAPRRKPII